ncbi:hypothetical protein Y032_0042g537 [Ancylostoma ceylanicum]|uniref:Uncharacterized protein n=1 Tax=Ancylostoma ceylanicum TaxID=53326 RepID=A0A016UEP8_9BILA|nr:hypothetical protein Y032_0042g537 [Ancylostoma ceylanicum]
MAVTHPRQGRRATAPHVPESLSLAVAKLFLGAFLPNLVILSFFSCFITRTSTMVANDIDFGARGAVAWRAYQVHEWVTAIDTNCKCTRVKRTHIV